MQTDAVGLAGRGAETPALTRSASASSVALNLGRGKESRHEIAGLSPSHVRLHRACRSNVARSALLYSTHAREAHCPRCCIETRSTRAAPCVRGSRTNGV